MDMLKIFIRDKMNPSEFNKEGFERAMDPVRRSLGPEGEERMKQKMISHIRELRTMCEFFAGPLPYDDEKPRIMRAIAAMMDIEKVGDGTRQFVDMALERK